MVMYCYPKHALGPLYNIKICITIVLRLVVNHESGGIVTPKRKVTLRRCPRAVE